MFCYLFYNSLVKPKRKYSLSWIGCESKHDLQKKPLGKPGFFTWAFPWMWSRIKQNKLETLVYLLNWRFSSFSAICVFRTKYCHIHSLLAAVQFYYWMKLHVVIIWGIMQIEEGVMAVVYDTLQDLYNSSNHMKDNIPNIPKNSSCYIYIAFCDFCYKSSIVKILIKIKKIIVKSTYKVSFSMSFF